MRELITKIVTLIKDLTPGDVHVDAPLGERKKRRRLPAAEMLEKATDTLYVCRRVANGFQLREWCKAHDLALDSFPHVTVAHSSTPVPGYVPLFDVVYAKPTGWAILGKDRALVLLLDSDALESRHEVLKAGGASWDHASYTPHMTARYLDPGEAVNTSALPLPPFPVILGPEEFGPVDEDVLAKVADPYASLAKYNHNHDRVGRFASTNGAGGAPNPADPKVALAFNNHSEDPAPLNGVKFETWWDAPTTHEGWKHVEGQNATLALSEPPLPQATYKVYNKETHENELKSKHEAAGVIIREPDGRIWVVEPTKHYGGYVHTFPKGTVEEGHSLQATAIKEAFEESGLQVKIIGHLADVERDTSVARYYLAERVGGSPVAHGWESQAVKLVPPELLPKILNRTVDKKLAAEVIGPKADAPAPEGHVTPFEKPAASAIMAKQVGAQGGSNKGGVYEGTDGVKRYVKLYNDPSQAAGEHLANRIYSELGHHAPDSQVFVGPHGDHAYASKIVDHTVELGKVGVTPERAQSILKGFAADVLTANWDAVGLVHDNVKFKAGTTSDPLRVDNGGSFLWRAKAGRKDDHLLDQVTEWKNFANPSVNPAYSAIFKAAGVASADHIPGIKGQVDAIVGLRDHYGGWKSFIKQHAPELKAKDAVRIEQMLEARTKLLQAQVNPGLKKMISRIAAVLPQQFEAHFDEADKILVEKYNHHHDQVGRFSSTDSGGAKHDGGANAPPPPYSGGHSDTAKQLNTKLNELSTLFNQFASKDPAKLVEMLEGHKGYKVSDHPVSKKYHGYKDELVAMAKTLVEQSKHIDLPETPKPLPGEHGIAKWNNKTLYELAHIASAVQLGNLTNKQALSAFASVSVSNKHHQSVKDYKAALLAAVGGDNSVNVVTTIHSNAPKAPKIPAPADKYPTPGGDYHVYEGTTTDHGLRAMHAAALKGDLAAVHAEADAVKQHYGEGSPQHQVVNQYAATLESALAPKTAKAPAKPALPEVPTHLDVGFAPGAKVNPGSPIHQKLQDMHGAAAAGLTGTLRSHIKYAQSQAALSPSGSVNHGLWTKTAEYGLKLQSAMAAAKAPAPTSAKPYKVALPPKPDPATWKGGSPQFKADAQKQIDQIEAAAKVAVNVPGGYKDVLNASTHWSDAVNAYKYKAAAAVLHGELVAQYGKDFPKPPNTYSATGKLQYIHTLEAAQKGLNEYGSLSHFVAYGTGGQTYKSAVVAYLKGKQPVAEAPKPASSSPNVQTLPKPSFPTPPTHTSGGVPINVPKKVANLQAMHDAAVAGKWDEVEALAGKFSGSVATQAYKEQLKAAASKPAPGAPHVEPPQPKLSPGTTEPQKLFNVQMQHMYALAQQGNAQGIKNVPTPHPAQQAYKKQLLEHLGSQETIVTASGARRTPEQIASSAAAKAVQSATTKGKALKLPDPPAIDPKYPLEGQALFKQKVDLLQQAAQHPDDPVTALNAIVVQSKSLSGYKSSLIQAVEQHLSTQPPKPVVSGALISGYKIIAHAMEHVGPLKEFPMVGDNSFQGHEAYRYTLKANHPDQYGATTSYQGGGSSHLNAGRFDPKIGANPTSEMRALDKAIWNAPGVHQDFLWIRNISSSNLADVAHKLVGHVVTDGGYAGGSLDGAFGSSYNVSLRVNVPKGSKALRMAVKGGGGFHHEKEVLFPRNTKIRVKRVYKNGYKTIIEAEMLLPHEQDTQAHP
jgi:ADP-ribose pyrophosphatase YjhB (NUDIX family)